MMLSALFHPFRYSCGVVLDRCYHVFPCPADPARRSSLGLKVALVMLHLVFVGVLFLFDTDLIEKTKHEPWYTGLYLFLFLITLVQYFVTSGSSPGYVLDAMRYVNETNAIFRKISTSSNKDNLLQAKMETWSLPLREVRQEDISREVIRHLGRSWSWECIPQEHPLELLLAHIVMLNSLHGQSIVMIVTDVFFSLIIIVYGLEHVLARVIIVDFGGTFVKRQHCASGLASCTLHT